MRRRTIDRISIAAMCACVAVFAGVLVLGPSDPAPSPLTPQASSTQRTSSPGRQTTPDASVLVVPPSSSRSSGSTAEAPPTTLQAAPCRKVAGGSGFADRCRTRSALLTIRLLDETVRLGEGTQARALRIRTRPLSGVPGGRRLSLTLRIRNATDKTYDVSAAQIYLFSRGRRIRPRRMTVGKDGSTLRPRATSTVTSTFALAPGVVRGIREDGGLLDLGVRPLAPRPGLQRVGVVRLEIDL